MTIADFLARLRAQDIKLWLEGDQIRLSAPPNVLTPALRAELTQRRAEVVAWLRLVQDAVQAGSVSILPADRGAPLPLSFAQERLWFLSQFKDASLAYHMATALHFDGLLDRRALAQSLQMIIDRHEVLRTAFPLVDGEVVQQIRPSFELPLALVDLSMHPADARAAALKELTHSAVQQPFDLLHGPLVRATLAQLTPSAHVLVLVVHHIIFDGWSVGLLAEELAQHYAALTGNASAQQVLPRLPVQYADYAVWQRQQSQSQAMATQISYWREHLRDLPASLNIPTDRPRPAQQRYHGAQMPFTLSNDLRNALLTASRAANVTLFMTLLTAFDVLLARYTGQTDIVVGTPVAGRRWPEVERVIGCFVNTLALRVDLRDNPTVRELLTRVQAVTLGAYAHQDLPFEQLVEALDLPRDPGRSPLVQALLVFQNVPQSTATLPGLTLERRDLHTGTAKFDLTLTLEEATDELRGSFEYNTDLFDTATIARLSEHFRVVLEQIATRLDTHIADLRLLTADEERRLVAEWNAPQQHYPAATSLHELVAAQAERQPDATAVVCEGARLSYRELNARANQLAHQLRAAGVGASAQVEACVGVCLDRSLDLAIALLAVLKAGAAYLPLDPGYPQERLQFMLHDARVTVLVINAQVIQARPELVDQLGLTDRPLQIIDLDRDRARLAAQPTTEPITQVQPTTPAYVIYTSGSTGQPKGVIITHQNVVRLLTATQRWFDFGPDDVWTLFHSYAFDFSVWELWGALCTGGRVVIVPQVIARVPEAFYALLRTQQVTVLNQTPSAFRQLIPSAGEDSALRLVIFGGEALDLHALRPWLARHGDARPRLVNMYGITETTVHVTYRPIHLSDLDGAPASLIGRAIPDLHLLVLDPASRQPVPVGVVGELYVGGAGLARGYLNRPALTAERFIPHPWSAEPGARLYATGDLARYRSDGDLEYLGRLDQQVKVRGYRIELGDIEAALREHPQVRDALTIVRDDPGVGQRLVAYVVGKEPGAKNQEPTADESGSRLSALGSASELRRFLQQRLPEHMIPAAFVTLDALPLTTNGKLDRAALPIPDGARPALEEPYVAPRTTLEATLAGIWAQVLGVDRVGIHDNFFALGGDSIRSIQVLTQAHSHGLSLSIPQLFQHQTIARLCQAIEPATLQPTLVDRVVEFSLISAADRERLPPDVEDAYPLAALQSGMLFHSEYSPTAAIYHDIFTSYLRAPLDVPRLHAAIQTLISRHAVLRTSFNLTDFSEPLQIVYLTNSVPLHVADLSELSHADQEAELSVWLAAEQQRPFDWTSGPLVRFQVHRRSAATFQLTLSFHHAILDGWSVAVMLTELFSLYLDGQGASPTQHTAAEQLEYHDFVALEQEMRQSQAARQYWIERLAGCVPMRLPRWETPSTPVAQPHVQILTVPLAATVSHGLYQLARSAAVPIKSVALAAHLRVMALLGGTSDVLTGLVSNGRPETSDSERVLGLFLNTLPLRLELDGGSWRDLAQQTFALEQELLPQRWYPLLEIQRDLDQQTLFETAFNFTHFHVYERLLSRPDFHVETTDFFQATNFTLMANFSLELGSAAVLLNLEYDAAQLGAAQIATIGQYYATALAAMANAPDARYDQATLLTPAELALLLSPADAPLSVASSDATILDSFAAQVRQTPDAVAVVAETGQMTYRVLDQRANQLAHHLQQFGVGPDVLVGVYLERSLDLVVSLLGILKAGGAYVPLDPSYPQERLQFMLHDAAATVVVTQQALVRRLGLTDDAHTLQWICLDADAALIAAAPTQNPDVTLDPDNLAYMIYTSGSTGQPKGALNTHRGIRNRLVWMQAQYGLSSADRVLQKTPMSFDVSVWEFFWPLITGARLVLARPEGHKDPAYLVELIATHEITTLHFVPSMLHVFLQEHDLTRCSSLRRVICSGEALSYDLQQRCFERLQAELHNLYGPTEAAVDVTAWACQRDSAEQSVPIGWPIANTQIYLLNAQMQPVPIGVAGELYIGGVQVGRGYHKRPALTAERFVPDPFSTSPGMRLYRTGDLACWRADGAISYLGRLDQQIKLRGFRIELGEIEAVLRQHPAVRDAALVALADGRDTRLVAYVVEAEPRATNHEPRDGTDGSQFSVLGSVPELRAFLSDTLPDYMIPAAFVMLDALPLTPNGKLDRRALPVPNLTHAAADQVFVEPRTMIEEIIASIWADVLGLERVGINDHFSALGGHSLFATQVIARVRQAFGIELPLRALFETPTVAGLAAQVTAARQQAADTTAPPLQAQPRDGSPPLSFAQQRLWFLDQLEPDSAAYNLAAAIELTGQLDIAALHASLQAIVQRHDTLRTTFPTVAGRPMQQIAPAGDMPLPLLDLQSPAEADQEHEIRRIMEAEARRPFDLQRGPLLRTMLLRLTQQRHIILLTMHHIVSDGWSISVLMREVAALYRAYHSDQPASLAPLPIQYADYAIWQRAWLQGQRLEQQMAYWRQQLGGQSNVKGAAPVADVPILQLPTDYPRPAVLTGRGASYPLELDSALQSALVTLSQRENVTLFMTLLAAFETLLARLSGQDDFAVGTPIAGRTQVETEGLIGFFVNTLVLRANLGGNPSFRELLQRTRTTCLQAYDHQDLPFEQIVEDLRPARDLSRHPLFQVMFVLQNAPSAALELPDLRLQSLPIASPMTKFDLLLLIEETEQGLRGTWEYSTDLFAPETIAWLTERMTALLTAIVSHPQQRLGDLPLLTAAERQQMNAWNQHTLRYPRDMRMHELFEAQARRTPDAVALVAGGRAVTYHALNQQANQLAHILRARGVGQQRSGEVCVGICVERSIELVIGLLGILKAGGAYVPLDPAYPRERLQFMLNDAHAAVLLTQSWLLPELPPSDAQVLCLDRDWSTITTSPTTASATPASSDALAYVIYTSGSTGVPKGVAITHRSVVALIAWAQTVFSPAELSGVVATTSICFDLSVFELFVPLCTGGQVILLNDALAVAELPPTIEPTLINSVPSVVSALLRSGDLPRSVQTVNLAGEPLARLLADQLYARPGITRVLNLYGPSEDTTYSTYTVVAAEDERAPTIGRPIANTQVYLLDAQMEPVPLGTSGELYLGGDGLARGYLHRPALTAERFLPNPFAANDPGARMYRSGDLARYRPDGTLEFLGRVDQQVKVRGFRIELGEIEAVLQQHPAVREAVVVTRTYPSGASGLVAYCTPAQPSDTSSTGAAVHDLRRSGAALTDDLLHFLREKLPTYMIPATAVMLDSLPLTPNGKIDRRALPAPTLERRDDRPQTPATTPVQELLVGIWAELLDRREVSIHDNFFDLGGHSLLATQLAARLRTSFQLDLPLRLLFERPTIAGLSEYIAAALRTSPQESQPEPPRPRPRNDDLPLSFAQQRLWFLEQLAPGSAAYTITQAVQLRGPLHVAALQQALDAVVARHETLRTTFATRQGQPVQLIAPTAAITLVQHDLQALAPGDQRAAVQQLQQQQTSTPFDLRRGPLLRVTLLRLEPTTQVLVLTLHHLIADGWSVGVLLRELVTLYAAARQGAPAPLAPLPIQYADLVQWQHETLVGPALDARLAYWRAQLADAPPVLQLPTDWPRPSIQNFQGARQSLQLSAAVTAELRRLSRAHESTLFMTLLAAWALLLARLSDQDDLCVGTPIANRTTVETEALIGLLINTLVLRVTLDGTPTFATLLRRVRETCLHAYAHQDLPFEKLVEALQPSRDLSRNPLFDVLINFINTPITALELPELSFNPVELPDLEAKFALTLYIEPRGEILDLHLVYQSALFSAERSALILAQYQQLLEQICAAPDQPINFYSLVTPETRALLADPRVGLPEPIYQLTTTMILAWADRTPSQSALSHAGRSWTYRQLADRSLAIAAALRSQGCARGDVVAVTGPKSFGLYTSMIGALLCGGVLLSIDQHLPLNRQRLMLQAARARYLVRAEPTQPTGDDLTGAEVLFVIDVMPDTGDVVDGAPIEQPADALSLVAPDDPAYIFFTSGTTATPKAILGSHKGLSHFLTWQRATFGVGPHDRAAQLTGLSFDVVLRDIFLPLISGATLCLPDDPDDLGADQLLPWMEREQITLLHTVPTLAQAWLSTTPANVSLPSLRHIFFAGEPLTEALVRRWRSIFADTAQIVNLYGPTETTLAKCYYRVPAEPISGIQPVGQPLPQTQALVIAEDDRLCGIGEPGEIVIRTPFRSLGYINGPAGSERRFIRNPYRDDPQDLLYRTGDRGRYRLDGSLDILGRLDHQLKIHGVRVEPDEVAALLARHPAVAACAVMPWQREHDQIRLVAYAVVSEEHITAQDLQTYLGAHLPAPMIPSTFMFLEQIPRTANGKVDRQRLPSPTNDHVTRASPIVSPSTPIEQSVALIWSELLGRDQISIHDNFFDLGGHSLLATQLIARLRTAYQIELPLRSLFEAPTIATVARLIEQAQLASAPPPSTSIKRVARESRRVRLSADDELTMLDDDPGSGA